MLIDHSLLNTYLLDILHVPQVMSGIQQETIQTCLLPVWTSKGERDIKQIITCMKSVFKRQSVRANKGITYLEVTCGWSGVRKGLPEEVMFKLRSRG